MNPTTGEQTQAAPSGAGRIRTDAADAVVLPGALPSASHTVSRVVFLLSLVTVFLAIWGLIHEATPTTNTFIVASFLIGLPTVFWPIVSLRADRQRRQRWEATLIAATDDDQKTVLAAFDPLARTPWWAIWWPAKVDFRRLRERWSEHLPILIESTPAPAIAVANLHTPMKLHRSIWTRPTKHIGASLMSLIWIPMTLIWMAFAIASGNALSIGMALLPFVVTLYVFWPYHAWVLTSRRLEIASVRRRWLGLPARVCTPRDSVVVCSMGRTPSAPYASETINFIREDGMVYSWSTNEARHEQDVAEVLGRWTASPHDTARPPMAADGALASS